MEVDPDQTIGAGVRITRRIPKTGRQAMDVRRVPPVHLTFLPVLRPGQEESGSLERIAEFTEDETMFWPTRLWLPVAEFTVEVREPHLTTAATPSEILREIEAIRVLEGGTGYYMGGAALISRARIRVRWLGVPSRSEQPRASRLHHRGARGANPQRTLLVWGGVDAAGLPFLDPAFVMDAPPTLPRSGGPYTLTGKTADGEELFSIDFGMQEVADGDEGSGFVFALPFSPAWADLLKAIELAAPGGVATLDETSDRTVALLRDARTGRVRGILGDHANGGNRLGPLAGVAADLEILVSPCLPTATQWRR